MLQVTNLKGIACRTYEKKTAHFLRRRLRRLFTALNLEYDVTPQPPPPAARSRSTTRMTPTWLQDVEFSES